MPVICKQALNWLGRESWAGDAVALTSSTIGAIQIVRMAFPILMLQLRDQDPRLIAAIWVSIAEASTVRGTAPALTTVSLKSRKSKRAPNSVFTLSRRRLISVWPTL